MIIRPEKWIIEPEGGKNGLLKTWSESGEVKFPFPLETHNVCAEDVLMGEKQDFEIILKCADKPKVYKDGRAFNSANENSSMALESVIPVGLFSSSGDADFLRTPHIIMNGRVLKIYNAPACGFDEADVLFSLSCLGNEFDVLMHPEFAAGVKIKKGCIVSCAYRVCGEIKAPEA